MAVIAHDEGHPRHRLEVKSLKRGLLSTVPLAPGVAAFGLLYGVMARQAGLSPGQAWLMSLMVHAGSAQFAVLGAWRAASAASIILMTLTINLRHLLLGASIAPHLRGASRGMRAFAALWLTDESYALAMAAYARGEGSVSYLLGANIGIFVVWPLGGLLGALGSAAIPDPSRFGLDLVFPLTFLALLMAFVTDRSTALVAVLAAILALIGAQFLPGKWYIIAAALIASVLGVMLEQRSSTRNKP